MRLVLAIGGNALLPRGGRLDARVQLDQLTRIGPALGRLAREYELIVVHGNGPQVGLLAAQSGADPSLTTGYPLDDLVAETQGMIGYWMQQTIANHGGGDAVTLVSQTLVDPDDPAFAAPTKFIGRSYDRGEADALAAQHGWTVKQDGAGWRRVVPSPTPYEILELGLAERLLEAGTTVILAGGGGIPVVSRGDRIVGVEAVVDKDLAAGQIAERLGADLLVIITDVPGVMTGYGTAEQQAIGDTTPEAIRSLDLPEGSMGPKVRAVERFVRNTGRRAAIGDLADIDAVVAGRAGTQVTATGRVEDHDDVTRGA